MTVQDLVPSSYWAPNGDAIVSPPPPPTTRTPDPVDTARNPSRHANGASAKRSHVWVSGWYAATASTSVDSGARPPDTTTTRPSSQTAAEFGPCSGAGAAG